MKRLLAIILAALLPAFAFGQAYSVTNDILALSPTAHPIQGQIYRPITYRVLPKQSGSAYPLSSTNRVVSFQIFDGSSTSALYSYACTISNGAAMVNYTPTAIVEGWALMRVYNMTGGVVGSIAWDNYTVTSVCSSCSGGGGGGGDTFVTVGVAVAVSAPITGLVVNAGSTSTVNNTFSPTFAPSTTVAAAITIYQPSGVFSINGATGPVTLVVSPGWAPGITTNTATGVITLTTGLPNGTTGVQQQALWDGSAWAASAFGAPGQTPNVGTNWTTFTNLWPTTNTWVVPVGVTQVLITAWGASCNYSGGGGFVEALWVGSPGTILSIVNGTAGTTATNGMPGGGYGINGGNVGQYGGGGYTAVYAGTGIVVIAAGAGNGAGSQAVYGGPGGGFYRDSNNGVSVAAYTTNGYPGQGAWASNEYGLAATGGTNIAITGTSQNGTYLQGGAASTNGCTAGLNGILGGGGGGYYGGAGGTRTNALAGAGLVTGGGGVSYVNSALCTFGKTYRGQHALNGVPVGQDRPTYVPNKGSAGAPGATGFQW